MRNKVIRTMSVVPEVFESFKEVCEDQLRPWSRVVEDLMRRYTDEYYKARNSRTSVL